MNAPYDIAAARRGCPRRALRVVAVVAVASSVAFGFGQKGSEPATEESTDVRISVHEAQPQGQLIAVPVNQGVLVDFNVPVREMRIANPEIADVSPMSTRQILVNGRSFGTTQLVVTVDGGTQRVFTVAVDLDLERLQASIRSVVPRAQVKASALLDAVVMTGTVPDAESAERIVEIAEIYSPRVINHMRVAGVYQVVLRCTVAEVSRSATRQLGFNGWMAGDNLPDVFGVSQLNGINPVNIGAAGGASVTGRIPFATDQSGLSLGQTPTLSLGFPRVQMQIFIQALRQNGLLQVLAEPNLVAISGQEASFLAGGEYPVPIAQRDSVTVEFREFGVMLKFTPTVLGDDVIRLQVSPEVSEPDFSTAVTIGGFVVPGLIQRRIQTVVELGPGQTFALGGLLSEKTRAVSRRVPALGDIPVLGSLFSSVEYQSDETELVILVTPELVAPLNPNQVAHTPGTDHIPPNDWELFALGQIDGAQPVEGEVEAMDEETGQARGSSSLPTALRLRGPIGLAGGGEGT